MKKIFLLCAFILLSINSYSDTWEQTNLTNVTSLAITGTESHNGELFATVFNGYAGSIYKLNSSENSWTEILIPAELGIPRSLKSCGDRLYVSTILSGVQSNLHYSTDGCKSFIVDTAGIPNGSSARTLIYGLYSYNNKIIVNIGSVGYYLKDLADSKFRSINVPTALYGGVDPITYSNGKLFAYDNTGTNTMYISDDYGATWNVLTTDLPKDYGTNRFISDPVTGRLYSAGLYENSTKYGIFYSDNLGKNWTMISSASKFMKLNSGGTQQLVTAMYANDKTFYIALQNDKMGTSPDIVGTTTGLNNLSYDTLGLPANSSDEVNGVRFVTHNNKLIVQMNAVDIYIKSISTGLDDNHSPKSTWSVYPNPAKNMINISYNELSKSTNYEIYDVLGNQVKYGNINGSNIDVSTLIKGVYIIKLYNDNQYFESKQIVIE